MLNLLKDVAELAQQPTDERVRALKRIIPCSTIKSILKKAGCDRDCPRLPKWFMVWFVIGLGLFCCDCYRQIFRWLQPFRRGGTPGRSTLGEARQRLGVAPLRWLMDKIVKLRGTRATPGAFGAIDHFDRASERRRSARNSPGQTGAKGRCVAQEVRGKSRRRGGR